MGNLTTFPQLRMTSNDPSQSNSPNPDYATTSAFAVEGFTSLINNSEPIKYLTIPNSDEETHTVISVKGIIVNSNFTTQNYYSYKFRQIFCRGGEGSTSSTTFYEINTPLNPTVSPLTSFPLYNITDTHNYILYNESDNTFECYLALSVNAHKLLKGTYLLM